jgi:hypothetical protein
VASLSPGREHPAVLSAAVGGDWSRQRVVMVGRRGLQRRAFLSLSGRRCQDMLTDPHRPSLIFELAVFLFCAATEVGGYSNSRSLQGVGSTETNKGRARLVSETIA